MSSDFITVRWIGKELVDGDEILLKCLNGAHKSAVDTGAQQKSTKINKNILWQPTGLWGLQGSIGHLIIICEFCATGPLYQKNAGSYMHSHKHFSSWAAGCWAFSSTPLNDGVCQRLLPPRAEVLFSPFRLSQG